MQGSLVSEGGEFSPAIDGISESEEQVLGQTSVGSWILGGVEWLSD